MKKKLIVLGLALTMVFSMTACGSKNTAEDSNPAANAANEATQAPAEEAPVQDATQAPAEETAALKGTVVITGSTSVEKILNDMIDEFTALNPDVEIKYTGSGSSAGIQDNIDGINTLGASSRELKEEEKAAVVPEIFAYDGIAIVVNPANATADITLENLSKIYSGEVTNWNQIGGADSEIVAVSREGASGTRSAFEELIKLEDAGGLSEKATVVEGNGNVQSTVAGNENAIGYVSFSFIDETVKALTVGGAEANAENAKAGTYPLSRPFLLVYSQTTITPEAKAFIDFAKSADGQVFVENHGGIKID